MVLAFALLHLALASSVVPQMDPRFGEISISAAQPSSLSGWGTLTPQTWPARVLTVMEGGIGFGFLAMVITYLPVLYEGLLPA